MANSHESEALRAQPAPDEPGITCSTSGQRCSTYVECAATGCKSALDEQAAGQEEAMRRAISLRAIAAELRFSRSPTMQHHAEECDRAARCLEDAAAPHPPAQRAQAEAVAWRYRVGSVVHLHSERLDHYYSLDDGRTYIKGEPLYATPQQAAGHAADRAPLRPFNRATFNRATFNLAEFVAAFQRAASYRGKTMKEISAETGVSETTLSRMNGGERAPDAASLAALSAWAGLNPAKFCDAAAAQPQRGAGEGLVPLSKEAIHKVKAWPEIVRVDYEIFEIDRESVIDFARAIEQACAEAWGVKLGIRPAGSEGKSNG